MQEETKIDAAKVGRMYVTKVTFQWIDASSRYEYDSEKGKEVNRTLPAHWSISARLTDKPSQYGNNQEMSFDVEQGVGQKLAEVLLPVVVADASRKAQQLADDSKAMMAALGTRCVECITDMAATEEKTEEQE